MTQKEKARAYDEALEKARKMMNSKRSVVICKQALETIFPQLRDSNDEKMRKWLVDYFKAVGKSWIHRDISPEQILAYLEKQKEQKPEHFELKAGKWYICHRAFCCRADHLTVKEGERFMCEKDGVVKGFIIKEPEKYFKECSTPEPMEKEQKPAEWSKEDEEMLNSCISSIEEAKENRYAYKETDGDTSYDHEIAWLKSLRPSWKPSEEQMEALLNTLHPDDPYYCDLQSLYNDLKKLM